MTSNSGIILLLASAAMHSVWNALIRRSPRPKDASLAVLMVAFVASIVGIAVAAMAEVSLVPKGPNGALGTRGMVAIVCAGLGEAGYFIFLGRALSQLPLGQAYAIIRGLSMVLVWAISVAFLGEPLTTRAISGSLLVVLGLCMPALGAAGTQNRSKTLKLGPQLTAMACGLCVTTYHLAYGQALATGLHALPVFGVSLGLALPLAFGFAPKAQRASVAALLREKTTLIVVAGLLCTTSFFIFLVGLGSIHAGLAITLRNTSVVFAQLLSLVLGDRPTRSQWACAAMVFVGIIVALG